VKGIGRFRHDGLDGGIRRRTVTLRSPVVLRLSPLRLGQAPENWRRRNPRLAESLPWPRDSGQRELHRVRQLRDREVFVTGAKELLGRSFTVLVPRNLWRRVPQGTPEPGTDHGPESGAGGAQTELSLLWRLLIAPCGREGRRFCAAIRISPSEREPKSRASSERRYRGCRAQRRRLYWHYARWPVVNAMMPRCASSAMKVPGKNSYRIGRRNSTSTRRPTGAYQLLKKQKALTITRLLKRKDSSRCGSDERDLWRMRTEAADRGDGH